MSEVVELSIGGMTCAACANRVERKLNKLDGVAATVNFATARAHVSFTAPADVPVLVRTVEATGYTAALLTDDATRETRGLGPRLLVAAVFTAAVMLAGWTPLAVALTTVVVTWGAWPFHRAA